MEVEELERRLKENAGTAIVYSTDSEKYVGAIWVHKRRGGPLILEDFTPESELYKEVLSKDYQGSLTLADLSPESELYKSILEDATEDPKAYKQTVKFKLDVKKRWIMVLVREVNKKDYVGPEYIIEKEDARKHDVHYVKSIPELQERLNSLGFSIADLKPLD